MPNYRAPRDYAYGTLLTAATLSDTTISSSAFASLPSDYTTNNVLPITLHNPELGVYEVVWVTAHTASATTVTVARGKEVSSARAWPSGTQWVCAPTQRDGLLVTTRAALPTDWHTGSRAALSDEGITVQRTLNQGWQADVGVAVPAEYGLRQAGTAVPSSRAILMRGGQVTVNTNASGQLQVTYTSPFPTETLHATVSWVAGGSPPLSSIGVVAGSHTASGFQAYLYRGDTGASAGSGVSVTFSYLATGY